MNRRSRPERRAFVPVTAAHLHEGGGPIAAGYGRRWWHLELQCGHTVDRAGHYTPLPRGRVRFRGRSRAELLPAPRRARCDECPNNGDDDRAGRILDACARCGPDGAGRRHAFRGLCSTCGSWVTRYGDPTDYPRATVPLRELVEDAVALRLRNPPARNGTRNGRPVDDVGMSWAQIADLLGVTPRALEKARQRTGFPDPHANRPIVDPATVRARRAAAGASLLAA